MWTRIITLGFRGQYHNFETRVHVGRISLHKIATLQV